MYNKLFGKILDSSIWLEPDPTRIVWITLLAAMDEDGFAHFSALQNLADRAKVSLEAARIAVERFQAPDPDSGNPANEGRRIERVPGGWLILNAEHYRGLFTAAIKREKTRERVARFRSKNKELDAGVTAALPNVTLVYEYTSEFESFWKAYPIHKSKGAAFKAWKRLAPDAALQAQIMDAIPRQTRERFQAQSRGQFVPEWKYAATWLNQRCWEDEPVKAEDTGHAAGKTKPLSAVDRVRHATSEREAERQRRASAEGGRVVAPDDLDIRPSLDKPVR